MKQRTLTTVLYLLTIPCASITQTHSSCICIKQKLALMQDALTTIGLLQHAINNACSIQHDYLHALHIRLENTELSLEEKKQALIQLIQEKEYWLRSLAELEKTINSLTEAEISQATIAQDMYNKSEEIRIAQDALFMRLVRDIAAVVEPC